MSATRTGKFHCGNKHDPDLSGSQEEVVHSGKGCISASGPARTCEHWDPGSRRKKIPWLKGEWLRKDLPKAGRSHFLPHVRVEVSHTTVPTFQGGGEESGWKQEIFGDQPSKPPHPRRGSDVAACEAIIPLSFGRAAGGRGPPSSWERPAHSPPGILTPTKTQASLSSTWSHSHELIQMHILCEK